MLFRTNFFFIFFVLGPKQANVHKRSPLIFIEETELYKHFLYSTASTQNFHIIYICMWNRLQGGPQQFYFFVARNQACQDSNLANVNKCNEYKICHVTQIIIFRNICVGDLSKLSYFFCYIIFSLFIKINFKFNFF